MKAVQDDRPFTEVAVGIVFNAAGQVLLAQRPPGKAYSGWWEFPGGKIERGESVAQALARELSEELDLTVEASFPWVLREHSYEHARVRLHFHRVFDVRGEPRGLEQQAFAWQNPLALAVAPLLPAALPLLPWLALPTQLDPSGEQAKDPALKVVRCARLEDLSLPTAQAASIILLEPGLDWERALERLPAPGYVPLGTPGADLRRVQGFWT